MIMAITIAITTKAEIILAIATISIATRTEAISVVTHFQLQGQFYNYNNHSIETL